MIAITDEQVELTAEQQLEAQLEASVALADIHLEGYDPKARHVELEGFMGDGMAMFELKKSTLSRQMIFSDRAEAELAYEAALHSTQNHDW